VRQSEKTLEEERYMQMERYRSHLVVGRIGWLLLISTNCIYKLIFETYIKYGSIKVE
jgi:hypothetical protein